MSGPDAKAAEMNRDIADYALIGDGETAALVSREGSVDWLCWPRFDSEACFASLLGDRDNGYWQIAPERPLRKLHRRYLGDTLILETEMECDSGVIAITDFMPIRGTASDLVRIVEGRKGEVSVCSTLALRFDYGRIRPLLRPHNRNAVTAVAGPNGVVLHSDEPSVCEGGDVVNRFTVLPGERKRFVLTHFKSHIDPPDAIDVDAAYNETLDYWNQFIQRCSYDGPFKGAVTRSLLTLKALIHRPTGGIVAAATASLPEWPGGTRNWDYRFCWLRDSTFTLLAFLHAGLTDEAQAWADWLVRTAAGGYSCLKPLYRVDGGRHVHEWEAGWLSGFNGSRPVRFGNAAGEQLQLDVYGEVVETFHFARRHGLKSSRELAELEHLLLRQLTDMWEMPDAGMWESRGEPRHHVMSKVSAWAAFDRACQRKGSDPADRERWQRTALEIKRTVLEKGYDRDMGSFVRAFDERVLDASVLRIPMVGFLPFDDGRVKSTITAVERKLMCDGFVRRYEPRRTDDGLLHENEGVFLACSFWLADNYAQTGRRVDAERLIERLIGTANDVGLLPEEIDPASGRMLGNFPQAFSHFALVNAAASFHARHGPAAERQERR